MATTAGHRLTLDPMGKYSNAFFSETTNMINVKLSPAVAAILNFIPEQKT
jgi:cyclopropane fatty-acyl-phospholipid synthase-like methyltransferase